MTKTTPSGSDTISADEGKAASEVLTCNIKMWIGKCIPSKQPVHKSSIKLTD